ATRCVVAWVAAVAAVALLVAACGGDDGEPDGAGSPPSAPAGGGEVAWPIFGFDLANSRFNPHETTLGVDEVDDLAELWRVDGLAGVASTPTVVDGVVYVGDFTGAVRAFDAATGDERWTAELDAGTVYG